MATSDHAFEEQENEEFVEIGPSGEVRPVNPQQGPRGTALRDSKGEYSGFRGYND
ncbi:hypothetical protein [Planktothrix sp. FACHB-1365]|uniref:hypothetical protein n=1 Tax=Planktothrix sp. FACHB-1365 TaxID=2692855 RepID=UPI0016872756|nr:hypothetical protein [Planktothrix sp. FACHB-1365]MBD2485544.1 hypothetical protein [Planktothrix sp. FACHB-1365]